LKLQNINNKEKRHFERFPARRQRISKAMRGASDKNLRHYMKRQDKKLIKKLKVSKPQNAKYLESTFIKTAKLDK